MDSEEDFKYSCTSLRFLAVWPILISNLKLLGAEQQEIMNAQLFEEILHRLPLVNSINVLCILNFSLLRSLPFSLSYVDPMWLTWLLARNKGKLLKWRLAGEESSFVISKKKTDCSIKGLPKEGAEAGI